MKHRVLVVRSAVVVGVIAVGMFAVPAHTSPPPREAHHDGGARAAVSGLDQLPLLFVPEEAPGDHVVSYAVRGREASVWLTAGGLRYRLHPVAGGGRAGDAGSWAVALDLVDATPRAPVGEDPLPTRVSYFVGPRTAWRTGVPAFGSVVYHEPWPGVDLVVSGMAGELKSHFVVRAGADPSAIRLAYRGATAVRSDADGSLVVETPLGGLREEAPVAYQEIDGRRVEVPVAFTLEGPGGEGRRVYGFRLGDYDPRHELVVDPVTLVSCGYIGGLDNDYGDDVAVDAAGNMYISGATSSTETTFPVLVGPEVTYNGTGDVFVAKVNAAGTALVYCGYIGGADDDGGGFLTIDADGNAYVSGYTYSDETTFPVVGGPDLTYNGGGDAFVAKVNAAGDGLTYCGYIGGDAEDGAYGIGVDSAGDAYVNGYTYSDETTFPVAGGPDLTYNGGGDAFVAKVNAAGDGLTYCGYVGGSDLDRGYGIAVSSAGNAYLTGQTRSTETTFPVAGGPDLDYNGGPWDVFVAKVNTAGDALTYCGYIGGSGHEVGWAIAVDDGGNAYVTGETASTEADFPVAVGPDLTYNGGTFDAFAAKVNATGTALVYCGYVGGSESDSSYAVAVDGVGVAYLAGGTASTEGTFPVAVGPDLTYNGGTRDAFVAAVNPAGSALSYCGYIGGSSNDAGYGVAVDVAGATYVTGETSSDESSFPVAGGPDLTYNGGYNDGFVAKVSPGGFIIFADDFESGNALAWSATRP